MDYSLIPLSWPAADDGTVKIDYYINPTQPWVANGTAVSAIQGAIATWEIADPKVTFVYLGTTDLPPVLGTLKNIIGWGANAGTSSIGVAQTFSLSAGHNYTQIVTALNLAFPWVALDCRQADNSCGKRRVSFPQDWYYAHGMIPPDPTSDNQVPVFDIQTAVTHEIGHWLSLDDLFATQDSQLTEYINGDAGDGDANYTHLQQRTLGLGDVLGERAVYPCDCSLPRIFSP